ncbi:peptidylprolyl isomerase [Limnochorda pilosa]|uniref:peptidylprolyl isomerase n=1 Tax=Limnochorda pilosa TaxID=1555112 RepID=A0A0K2SMV0_LIMPI|nr:SurA N-terminal domain-containing protein [Limnochorda pilosa]BAS28458.1 PpiC-type peptidyl-prolyl cis-trans isomerase [Limnochorda pilosa]
MLFQSLRRSTKWIIVVVVVAFGGTLLYVGGMDLFAGSRSATVEASVAEVNGQPVRPEQLNSQVARRIELLQAQGARVTGLTRESVRYEALQDLIDQSLLQQAAAEMKVSVDPAEVAQGIDSIRAQFPSADDYRAALRQAGLNESQLRNQIQESLRLQNVQEQVSAGVEVTDQEVAQAYEAVHLKQLTVSVQGDDEQAWKAAETKAASLRDRLAKGTSFEDAAKGDEQVAQSDLGFVRRSSSLPQAILDAAFSLKKGELSQPIKTSNGYRVLQAVEWKRAEGEEFAKEKDSIRQDLVGQKQQEAYQKWLEGRRAQAEIAILDPALRGYDLLVAGKLDEAQGALRQAIAAEPENAYLHAVLAQVLAQQEKLDEAVAEARHAVGTFDLDPELHLLLGNLLRQAEQPDEAVAQYQKASELDPYDLQLHLTLYGIYLDMDRKDEAEAERARLQEIQKLLEERQQKQEELQKQLEQQGGAGAAPEAGSQGTAPDATPPEDQGAATQGE